MIFFLLACETDVAPKATEAPEYDVDMRLNVGDWTEPAAGEVFFGPDVVIPAGGDVMYCLVGTYTGTDQGVHTLTTYQAASGHHLVLMGTTATAVDYADGEIFDCTTTAQLNMSNLEPIVLATTGYTGGAKLENEITIPEGMAVKLDAGQRWVMQAHYLNTSTESIRVRDVAVLEYVPPENVTTWAAPFVLNNAGFSIPAGTDGYTEAFDCTFGGGSADHEEIPDTGWYALYLNSHMHEWGKAFQLTRTRGAVADKVIDIPAWNPYFRDAPPTTIYAPDTFDIAPGDTFRTSCTWFNDTDTPIEFPDEMCDSVGLVYPQRTPVICDAE